MPDSFVLWITGVSGAGKSSLSDSIRSHCDRLNLPCLFLDGDILRQLLGKTSKTTYSLKSRKALAFKYSYICKILSDNGFNVVISTISLFHEVHNWNKSYISNYIEVFLDTPIFVALERLQSRANKSNNVRNDRVSLSNEYKSMVGIDLLAEYPLEPDYHIYLNDLKSADEFAQYLITRIFQSK